MDSDFKRSLLISFLVISMPFLLVILHIIYIITSKPN